MNNELNDQDQSLVQIPTWNNKQQTYAGIWGKLEWG